MEVFQTIERKVFGLKWSGVAYRSLISISEKGNKKSFRSFLTKEGCSWLANRLRLAAEEAAPLIAEGINSRNRWRDHQATLRTESLSNAGGRFLQLEIMPASKNGKGVRLCFPAGKEMSGWKNIADFLTTFANPEAAEPPTKTHNVAQGGETSKTYAQAVSGSFTGDRGAKNPGPTAKNSSLVMQITTKVENFSLSLMSTKLQQMELWINSCKSMGGNWNSSWDDDLIRIDVSLMCPVTGDASPPVVENNNKSTMEKEDDDMAHSAPPNPFGTTGGVSHVSESEGASSCGARHPPRGCYSNRQKNRSGGCGKTTSKNGSKAPRPSGRKNSSNKGKERCNSSRSSTARSKEYPATILKRTRSGENSSSPPSIVAKKLRTGTPSAVTSKPTSRVYQRKLVRATTIVTKASHGREDARAEEIRGQESSTAEPGSAAVLAAEIVTEPVPHLAEQVEVDPTDGGDQVEVEPTDGGEHSAAEERERAIEAGTTLWGVKVGKRKKQMQNLLEEVRLGNVGGKGENEVSGVRLVLVTSDSDVEGDIDNLLEVESENEIENFLGGNEDLSQ